MENIINILNGLGAVALFLFGMKMMNDGIQRVSSSEVRGFLNRMSNSKFKSFIAGLGLTSIIQSSSAVSVLTLSFINAGLIGLLSAFYVIIGSNIGTTLTLWIVSLGFEIKISQICLPILIFAVPFYFSSKVKYKNWAVFVIGFALIFISLNLVKINLAYLAQEDYWLSFFKEFNSLSYLNAFFYVLVGLVLTVIVQSSSASTSIMVILHTLGVPLEAVAMMIIGANIGTTSTALIASSVGNTNAKNSAYFHLLYNVLGAFVIFFFTEFIIGHLKNYFTDYFFILAAYHTIFNIIPAVILYPFIKELVRYFKPIEEDHSYKKSLPMVHSTFSATPELYIYEANKMILSFAGNIKQTISSLGRMITESDVEKFESLHQRIIQLEEEGDALEKEIISYLNQIYKLNLTGENSQRIHFLMNVSKELENIGDLAIKTSYTHIERRKSNSFITPKLRTHLLEIQDALSTATTHFIQNLNEETINPDLPKAKKIEQTINTIHQQALDTLLKALDKQSIKPVSSLYYRELIQNYELMGDHIYKANKSLVQ